VEALLETWRINDRINRYLLDSLGPEVIAITLTKGKAVGDQFAHIHNVRLMWLQTCAPDLHAPLAKIDKGVDKERLAAGLEASGAAIEEVLRRAGTPDGRVKGFKPHATGFVGYMIAHESFHRAQVELALRQAGTPVSEKVAYGMWEWGVR
jgi:uncharacterized damage-inducible protein DinB